MRFVLLGSGCVRPDLERWGPCQALEVGGQWLVFDCGRGATMRMVEAGISIKEVKRCFFTHHHYDHNCDFPYFFLTSWTLGRNFPLEVYGPRGTEAFCDGLLGNVYRDDIASRKAAAAYNDGGCEWTAHDVLEDAWTLEGEGYRITAVHTVHVPEFLDSLAFKIDAEGKSIVICGDNRVSEPLMDLAAGCDLLVHECTFPTERIEKAKWGGFHTSPRELGRWAKQRGVKQLMLKHFAVQEGVAVEPMAQEVREEFGDDGLIVGRDLLEVNI
jgi:ribonuclease Z